MHCLFYHSCRAMYQDASNNASMGIAPATIAASMQQMLTDGILNGASGANYSAVLTQLYWASIGYVPVVSHDLHVVRKFACPHASMGIRDRWTLDASVIEASVPAFGTSDGPAEADRAARILATIAAYV